MTITINSLYFKEYKRSSILLSAKHSNLFLLYLATLTFFNLFSNVTAIGCYKCSSTNNDSSCIDPFNPGLSPHNFYEPDCKSGIPGRYGLFPARFCLKVSGYIAGTRDQIVIRTCTVSKLLDSDSSHSSFTLQLDENTNVQVLSGLIASCKDDGCNHAASLLKRSASKFTSLCIFAIFTFLINYFRW